LFRNYLILCAPLLIAFQSILAVLSADSAPDVLP